MKTKNLKNNKKILMLGTALVSVGSATSINEAHGAAATVAAFATVVSAISFVGVDDLHFGRVVPAVGAGTAVISPAGAQSYTGGVADGGSVGVAQAALFTIDGTGGVNIQVTAAPVNLADTALVGPDMTLSTIKYGLGPTANTDTTTFQIPTTATIPINLTVGGTIAVGAAQTEGNYVGSLVLTANYM